jgi:hypothetical protein
MVIAPDAPRLHSPRSVHATALRYITTELLEDSMLSIVALAMAMASSEVSLRRSHL